MTSFEMPPQPPPEGSSLFLQSDWDALRDSGILPLNVSSFDASEERRAEFIRGAELLGLGRKRMPKLLPQMLVTADAVNAQPKFMGILKPRRSSKTTSLFALAMGRIAGREDYLVSYTMATTALKARARFKNDVAGPLETMFPDKRTRPFVISYAGGAESVKCLETGSLFQFLAPKGESFRSDSWDLIIIDEGGEAEPAMSEDLVSGALATMDTRDDATMIVAGTAGMIRDGNLLFETLEDGRAGRNETGIVEYAAPPDTSLHDIQEWEDVVPLLVAAHPGIGTLTTLEKMHVNFDKMRRPQFLREYLSIFAKSGASSFIDLGEWLKLTDPGQLPAPPTHFRLAFKVHPLQTSASIAAVWRVDGKVHAGLLDHRKGVTWLYERLLILSRLYKVPIVYDNGNSVDTAEVEKLQRAKPRPQFEPQNWNAVSTAAASLLKEIETGNVVHYGQPELDEAIRVVTKRGTRDSKRWAFGRSIEEADITPIEAVSLALRAYDEAKPRVPIRIVTAA